VKIRFHGNAIDNSDSGDKKIDQCCYNNQNNDAFSEFKGATGTIKQFLLNIGRWQILRILVQVPLLETVESSEY
jgi:hypothetical protein